MPSVDPRPLSMRRQDPNGSVPALPDDRELMLRKFHKLVLLALMADIDQHWRTSARSALARYEALNKGR